MKPDQRKDLQRFALKVRIGVVEQFKSRGFGHVGGALSAADAVAVLYGGLMRIDPSRPDWPDRDKFVCSKGHAGPALYAALALKGYFPYEELATLNQPGTRLPSHCDRNKTPGIDMTTGSLGQGASLAMGMALGDRLKGRDSRVYLMVGDGELDEGQVWEATMFAAAKSLSNLTVFVDWNKKQLDGPIQEILNTGDLAAKFEAFGFRTLLVDGGDVEAIFEAAALPEDEGGRPSAIILDTVKGAGIREVEELAANHSFNVSEEMADRWIAQLRAELDALEEGGTGR